MSRAAIEAERLSKTYRLGTIGATTLREGFSNWWDGIRDKQAIHDAKDFQALSGVSFSIQPGEVVGVIGRNGAGKSTLLKILSRITEPTSGVARIRGRVASLLEVGTGFHPDLTGRENIFLNGAILGMTRAEVRRKFDEIVAFAEVEQFIDTPVKRYSSGMYVRLAFAVAAHLEPEILIVDEVLAVGDSQFQDKCLGKMESVAQSQGRTVIFVSHNIGAIARFCRRGILLERGKVAFDGRIEAAIDGYLRTGRVEGDSEIDVSVAGHNPDAPLKLMSVLLNAGSAIANRRPFTAEFRVRVTRPVQAGFGLGFSSVEGRRILTLESDYQGNFLNFPNSGTFSVKMMLPILDLIPSRYRIDVGAFGTGHVGYHYYPDCASVDVQPSSITPPHVHGTNGDWRPDSDWKIIS